MTNKRVPKNTNLNVWTQPSYQGLPINTTHELVEQYLHKLKRVIDLSTQDYSRVCAVIVQLHCAYLTEDLTNSNDVMERFKASVQAKVDSHQNQRCKDGRPLFSCKVRIVWSREQSMSHLPHFHVVLLFNRELFHRLDTFNSGNGSLLQIIQTAWLSALSIPLGHKAPLVYVPQNAVYYLNRSDDYTQLSSFFQHASYLCKVDTKCFGQRLQSFGGSRK